MPMIYRELHNIRSTINFFLFVVADMFHLTIFALSSNANSSVFCSIVYNAYVGVCVCVWINVSLFFSAPVLLCHSYCLFTLFVVQCALFTEIVFFSLIPFRQLFPSVLFCLFYLWIICFLCLASFFYFSFSLFLGGFLVVINVIILYFCTNT